MINIVLMEGQLLVREAIIHVIEAASHHEMKAALAEIDSPPPQAPEEIDIVLMNLNPENYEVCSKKIKQIRQVYTRSKLIIISEYTNPLFFEETQGCGIDGLLHKDISVENLIQAIELIHQGYLVQPSGASSPWSEFICKLTTQERIILKLLCRGLSRQEIATELAVSLNTIKSHLSNITAKSGYETITELIFDLLQSNN